MKYWSLIVLFFSLFSLKGQDVHWSQFDYNPIFQNPANVGHFEEGDNRIHFNYRDQWRSVTVPFQTFSFSGDVKRVMHDQLSLGGYFFSDIVGDGRFMTVELLPSASWLQSLDADSIHILRSGIQVGLNYRQFNADAFTFDSQWNGANFDQYLPTNEVFVNESRLNMSVGLGASYEWNKAERESLVVGVGLFNVNRPDQGFFGEEIKRPVRFNLFLNGMYPLGFDLDLLPSIQLNTQGSYRELLVGSRVRYTLLDRMGEYRALVAGTYLRSGDAAVLMGGIEWQNWWGGISYDINYSKLVPASRLRGGIEFSVRYIWKKFKPKEIKYRVCPEYI